MTLQSYTISCPRPTLNGLASLYLEGHIPLRRRTVPHLASHVARSWFLLPKRHRLGHPDKRTEVDLQALARDACRGKEVLCELFSLAQFLICTSRIVMEEKKLFDLRSAGEINDIFPSTVAPA